MGGVPLSCVLHRAQLRVADLQAEGLLGDSEECAALIGEGDLELAGALSGGGELLLAQKFLHGEGGVLRGVTRVTSGLACGESRNRIQSAIWE